ncbi:ragulator complex protein LAMTOR5 homolog [Sycon ciliatum]|uniref:ragulator complex protein LAMTOR5 homolog n=1 Tax=Sycon ciliatum TaxID=27933 RepID=UPI0031F6B084
MEKDLDALMNSTMSERGVVGVLCADKTGLTLSTQGNGVGSASGLVHSLATKAATLSPPGSAQPVVAVETDSGNILIQHNGNATVAVHKVQ